MKKEKSEGEGITYLGTFAGYEIFTKANENIVAKSDENGEWHAVMNAGMFHRQNHICKSWKELRKKLEHNRRADLFNKIFGRGKST